MKVQDILVETPYLHGGEYSPPEIIEKPSYISDSSLSRDYEKFGYTVVDAIRVNFFMLKNKMVILGVIPGKKEKTQEVTNFVIFSLRFKRAKTIINYPPDVNDQKVFQVDSVYTNLDFKGRGIASFVYIKLVELGYIVISDTSQFEDGKMLWKKISREAKFNNYVIHILDDEYGFMKDKKTGEVIAYDSSNIDDAKIWTSGANLHGEHILLMIK